MAKSKLAKRRRRRRKNPDDTPSRSRAKGEVIELATNIGAGFAGYAGTRLLSRMAYAQAVKRFPNASPYVHVAAAALGAAGVYFGTKHWSKAQDYHESASIGAGIALLQTAIQTFVPKFGWIVADVTPDQYVKKAKKKVLPAADMNQLTAAPEATGFDLDALLEENPDVEAVSIGQMEVDPDLPGDPEGEMGDLGLPDGDAFADLENFNGMLN